MSGLVNENEVSPNTLELAAALPINNGQTLEAANLVEGSTRQAIVFPGNGTTGNAFHSEAIEPGLIITDTPVIGQSGEARRSDRSSTLTPAQKSGRK